MKIYFARHGESHANLCHEVSNRGLTHPLTSKGRSQAVQLARNLRNERITRIYSSPLLRAIETSIIVANALEIEYEVTPALREYDCGEIEGRSDDQAWAKWQELSDAWLKEKRYSFRITGGESYDDLCSRFEPFIEGLLNQADHSDEKLLCVAHGGLYRMMLPRVLRDFDIANAEDLVFGYTACIVAEPQPSGLRCIQWNDRVL